MARIHLLAPETSRLIAAGEVIDRPASALRELLDNSIDAGATEIRVEIEQGGIDLVRVSDDGHGMAREDLELSILEHSTSKIENSDDLLTARTLGFRGEALASIAAVSRIEITSREAEAEAGWRLRKDPGGLSAMSPAAARKGTTVEARGFFETFPARRQFLKRASSESGYCRTVFNERAAAHPGIRFIWKAGNDAAHFPADEAPRRLALLFPELGSTILHTFTVQLKGASLYLVYADPSFHRRDRRFVQVYVNRRKVPEWGLSSVMEYAFSDYLPGGAHPCVLLFAEIDPSLADFNIHPAKREVRIKNIEEFKSGFLASFRHRLREEFGSGPTNMSASSADGFHGFPQFPQFQEVRETRNDGAFWERLIADKALNSSSHDLGPSRDIGQNPGSESASLDPKQPEPAFRYLGRAFGPFILFEMNEILYILDQHAAHERILFDTLSEAKAPVQPLLVPYILEDSALSSPGKLEKALPELRRMGYEIRKTGDTCVVEGIPSFLGERAIPVLLECLADDFLGESPGESITATMACRAAVKDGDILDESAARELVTKSLALPFPRCPHGRPLWVALDKTSLYRMVGRIP